MTKSEIFRRVAGYSGEIDAKERMFERDKDDLRELGIEIEVGGHDPLFEDEPGYRIRTESYQFDSEDFSAEELGIITTALATWEGSSFAPTSRTVVRRLSSVGFDLNDSDFPHATQIKIDEGRLLEISEAFARRITIEFEYQKSRFSEIEPRKVNVLGLCAWRSAWYFVAEDLAKDEVRVFKLNRITNGPKPASKPGAYEIPDDFSVSDYVAMYQEESYLTRLRVRSSAGAQIRRKKVAESSLAQVAGDWDELSIEFGSIEEAEREILWLGEDAIVLEPIELRKRVIAALQQLGGSDG